MDEAFSALDPLIRSDMRTLLLELQQELRKTIVFVTHDLEEAIEIGDRIAILRDGEIVQNGDSQDIVLRPADDYIAEFIQGINRGRVVRVGSIMAARQARSGGAGLPGRHVRGGGAAAGGRRARPRSPRGGRRRGAGRRHLGRAVGRRLLGEPAPPRGPLTSEREPPLTGTSRRRRYLPLPTRTERALSVARRRRPRPGRATRDRGTTRRQPIRPEDARMRMTRNAAETTGDA